MRKILSLILFCLGIVGPVYADAPKILKLSELRPDTKAIGFSVFKGAEPEPFDVMLEGVTGQGISSLILARVFGKTSMDTPLEKMGAISGMSGSPIFIGCLTLDDCIKNGTLVGALSYGLGSFVEGGTNVLLTPIEYMLGARVGGYVDAKKFLSHMQDKINVGGREFINLLLFPKMESLAVQAESAGKCKDSSSSELKPGSMVSVFLATGTVPFGVSGTVTWRDGDKIYVFGHPLYGNGIVNYPFTHVSVAATLQTPFRAHKITGCSLDTQGAMLVDGAFEMTGIIGEVAPMMPFKFEIHVDDRVEIFSENIAESFIARMLIKSLPGVWIEQLFGDIKTVSVAYKARIVLKNEPEIFLKSIIPSRTTPDSFQELSDRIDNSLQRLEDSGFKYEVESIVVYADFVRDLKIWKKKNIFLSKEEAAPGDTVYANVVLEEFPTGLVKQISIPVKVPDDFMDRVGPGDLPRIQVIVQSGSRFTDKRPVNNPSSVEDLVEELKRTMNLASNVLYVQQIMPKTEADSKSDKENAKLLSKAPWDWSDVNAGELRQLPSEKNLEFSLSTTPPLDNFIDLDATFSILIRPKRELARVAPKEQRKSKKWFLLFLK